jgi:hypothetical protein
MSRIGRRAWLTAVAFAAGIAEGAVIDGDPASPAADLRSTLTALLIEHVYLSGIVVATAYATALNSAEVQAAAAALDRNSVEVTEALGHHAETLAGAIDSFSGALVDR